jgi:hypothetical protein
MRAMKMNRLRWLELTLGLLPVTLICGPLIPFTLIIMLLPLLFGAALRLLSRDIVLLFLSFVGSGLGLIGLWLAFLFDPAETRSRPILFRALAVSLLAGMGADFYFFYLMIWSPGWNRYSLLWILLLIAPFLLAVKYFYLQVGRPLRSGL